MCRHLAKDVQSEYYGSIVEGEKAVQSVEEKVKARCQTEEDRAKKVKVKVRAKEARLHNTDLASKRHSP